MSNSDEKGSIFGRDLLPDETVLEPRKKVERSTDDLLTVVETIVHISQDNGTTQVKSGYDRRLKTKEQVYRRINGSVGKQWAKLDCNWLNPSDGELKVGLLLIKNEEPKPFVTPTEAEKKEADSKVIELAFGSLKDYEDGTLTPDMVILVGETAKFTPAHESIYIRCMKGGRYTLTAIPR